MSDLDNAIKTTENFFSVMSTFVFLEPSLPTFRLYYDDDGCPLLYTMEDIPGNYINIDRETYVLASPRVRVVDGNLRYLKSKTTVKKLVPNQHGGTACDTRDVCVIADKAPSTNWNIKIDEYD